MTKTTINKKVNVTAVYFQSKKLKTFPKRIEFDGDTYTFKDGLSYRIRRGDRLTEIYDMFDGNANYRLRLDASDWTLVNITRS